MIPCVQASYVAQFRRSINNFGATAAFSAKLLTDKSIGRCDYFIFYIFLASRGWQDDDVHVICRMIFKCIVYLCYSLSAQCFLSID